MLALVELHADLSVQCPRVGLVNTCALGQDQLQDVPKARMSEAVTITLPLSQHMLQGIGFAVVFALLAVIAFLVLPDTNRESAKGRFNSLHALKVLAMLLAPVWLWLIGHILWSLWSLSQDYNPAVQDTDLRWHILAFVGLITALGAMISAPLALIRVWTTERQTRTAEQGHMTDRISKAVEQLGAEKTVKNAEGERTVPNIEVRIGGLLSLERIAQDSVRYDAGRDHVRVMEILCAYVRENAPASDAVDFPLPAWKPLKDDATADEKARHLEWRKVRFANHFDSNTRQWAGSLEGPKEDIALAVRIIGRRDPQQRAIESTWGPEADETAVWVFDTPCPVLTEPAEDRAHGAEKITAHEAALDQWTGTLFTYRGYRLDLRKTHLQAADLSNLVLSGCRLDGARMEGADLRGARMEGAFLRRARMEGADLTGARMEGAFLTGARMEEITSLSDASFRQTALKDVDLTQVPITQEHVNESFGDASVTLPEGVIAPRHWPDWDMPYFESDGFPDQWRRWRDDPDGYVPPPPPDVDDAG